MNLRVNPAWNSSSCKPNIAATCLRRNAAPSFASCALGTMRVIVCALGAMRVIVCRSFIPSVAVRCI